MPLHNEHKKEIESIIKDTIKNKLKNYSPESNSMPFHYNLIGKDRMALYSFIQSLNTTFGASIYEPIAVSLAKNKFDEASKQVEAGDIISSQAKNEIEDIINKISQDGNTDKSIEIESIRKKCQQGKANKVKLVKVDIMLKESSGLVHMIDIKTAKPNKSSFKDHKRTLLEWVAAYLYQDPQAQVNSYIAIPYNPYEPNRYRRWTLNDAIDLNNELMVGKEFWDFLGGKDSYEEVLYCFEKAGIELREYIDNYFKNFKL